MTTPEATPTACPRCPRQLFSDHGDRWCIVHGTVATPPPATSLPEPPQPRIRQLSPQFVPPHNATLSGDEWDFLDSYGDLPVEWWDWATTSASALNCGASSPKAADIARARLQEARARHERGLPAPSVVAKPRKPKPEHLRKNCAGPGCDQEARSAGLCMSHYMQERRRVDPTSEVAGKPLAPVRGRTKGER